MGKAFPYPVCRGWSFAQCQPSVGGRSLEGLEGPHRGPQLQCSGLLAPPTLVTAFRVLSAGFRRFSPSQLRTQPRTGPPDAEVVYRRKRQDVQGLCTMGVMWPQNRP